MLYNYKQLTEDQKTLLIKALVGLGQREFENTVKHSESIDVVLTINGIEINFFDFCNSFWKQFNFYLKIYAKEYVEKALEPQIAFISNLQKSIDKFLETSGGSVKE
jgi:hypothetical protein